MEKSGGAEERKSVGTTEKSKRTGKLHRYQREGRQQPKRSVKKKSMDRNISLYRKD